MMNARTLNRVPINPGNVACVHKACTSVLQVRLRVDSPSYVSKLLRATPIATMPIQYSLLTSQLVAKRILPSWSKWIYKII